MPRFVILTHDSPELHWDFLLECGDALKSWRLPQTPQTGQWLCAQALDDHRLMYLDYEGPVSGSRGTVQRWDHGSYTWLGDHSTDAYRLRVQGHRLRGVVDLAVDRSTGPADDEHSQWREVWSFCFHES